MMFGAQQAWYSAAFGYKDATGNLSSKLRTLSESAAQTNYTYTYDNDGRLSTATASVGVTPGIAGSLGQTFSESYGFQVPTGGSLWNLQTVTSAKLPGGQDVYSYLPSPLGGSQQTEALYTIGAGSYASDLGTGNLTGWTRGGAQVALTYDAANRLTRIQRATATQLQLQTQELLQYDSTGSLAIRQFPAGSDANNAGEERRIYLGHDITVIKHTDATLDAVFHAPMGVEFWAAAAAVNGNRSGITYLVQARRYPFGASSDAEALTPATSSRVLTSR